MIVVKTLVISLLIPLVLALGLIASQRPQGNRFAGAGGLDFTGVLQGGIEMPAPTGIAMRDGYQLQVRDYGSDSGPLIILVHGSGWNGMQFNGLASGLQVKARVLVPDLRGHGAKPGRRGDVDYIGQLEDDLADLIAAKVRPGQKVVLVGHSSGGGLVVRFAGGQHGAMLDGAVLLAPFLKYDAPTTRQDSGGWARALTRRIIGLTMLNAVGIRVFNQLTVIEFNMPDAVLDGPLGHLATTAYSYRLNSSYAPRGDYLADVAALPRFLLVAGTKDEAFVAEGYGPLMAKVTDRGRYLQVSGVGHLDIVDAPQTGAAVVGFLDGLNP